MGGVDAEPVPFTDLHCSCGEGGEEAPRFPRDEESGASKASGGWEEHYSGATPTGGLG